MRVTINSKEQEIEPGTKLVQVIQKIREAQKDEPMIKSLIQKTGEDHIVFVLNGRIVRPPEYDSIELKEGDTIRWVHPIFGG